MFLSKQKASFLLENLQSLLETEGAVGVCQLMNCLVSFVSHLVGLGLLSPSVG